MSNTTNTTSITYQILELVDDIKTKIPDKQYKDIVELLQKQHQEDQLCTQEHHFDCDCDVCTHEDHEYNEDCDCDVCTQYRHEIGDCDYYCDYCDSEEDDDWEWDVDSEEEARLNREAEIAAATLRKEDDDAEDFRVRVRVMIEDDDSEEGQKSREPRIKKPDIEARIKASIREARIKKPDIEARIKASMEAYTQRKVEQQRLSNRWAWNYFTKMSRNDAEEVDEHTTLLPLFYGTYHCNGTSYYLGSNDTLYDMMTHELVGNIND